MHDDDIDEELDQETTSADTPLEPALDTPLESPLPHAGRSGSGRALGTAAHEESLGWQAVQPTLLLVLGGYAFGAEALLRRFVAASSLRWTGGELATVHTCTRHCPHMHMHIQ